MLDDLPAQVPLPIGLGQLLENLRVPLKVALGVPHLDDVLLFTVPEVIEHRPGYLARVDLHLEGRLLKRPSTSTSCRTSTRMRLMKKEMTATFNTKSASTNTALSLNF